MKSLPSTWVLTAIPLLGACLPSMEPDGGDTPSSTPPTSPPDAGGAQDIPEIVASGDSAVVGPRGGRVFFPEGIELFVPPGALEEDVTLRAHETATPPELNGPLLRPAIELLPDGLEFKSPVSLRLPSPGMGGWSVVAYAPGDPELEEIASRRDPDGSLVAMLWHFSTYVVYGEDWGPQTVGDIHTCTTAAARGLSRQIAGEFNELTNAALVPLTDSRITSADPLGAPLLQAPVASAIRATLDEATAQGPVPPFQVTSGWRSIAQQYILAHCTNANPSATPGRSNHNDGSAFDLGGPRATRKRCLESSPATDRNVALATVNPFWGPLLERHELVWLGDTGNVCIDPPHFDHVGASRELRSEGVLAFQRLWNRYRPCDPIPASELGTYGPETEERLRRSPVSGFSQCEDDGCFKATNDAPLLTDVAYWECTEATPTGGPITDGTYHVTAGTWCNSAGLTTSVNGTLVISKNATWLEYHLDWYMSYPGPPDTSFSRHLVGPLQVDGTTLHVKSALCGAVDAADLKFSASNNSLRVFYYPPSTSLWLEFTRQ